MVSGSAKRSHRWVTVAAMMMLALALSTPLMAAQSLNLALGATGSFQVPDRAPYNNIGSFRLELRLHDVQPNSSAVTELFSFNGYTIYITPTSQIRFDDDHDTCNDPNGKSISLGIAGRTDFVVRVTRDAVGLIFYAEIWNTDGTNYAISHKVTLGALGSNNLSGSGSVGKEGWQSVAPDAKLAFLRWYGSKVADNSTPPRAVPPGGDLADWEFEGNGSDGSPGGLNLSWTGTLNYVATPVYAPACSAGAQRTLRAGFPTSLDGSGSYPLDNGVTLSYLWQQLGGPTTVTWTGQATSQPMVSGFVFGQYGFQLTVTDGGGRSTSCTVTDGAVATDISGVVVVGDPNIAKLLGPMLQFGAGPWPWYDDRHKALADFFGGLQSTDYVDTWNTAAQGSIAVTNGSTAVVGTNTTFKADFCGGGTTPPVWDSWMTIWYPLDGGGTGRRAYRMVACPDDTHVTLSRTYVSSANESGLNYSTMGNLGYYIGNASHVNFYDNVMAFYSLYYRTGLTVYRDYARVLADRWWTMPFVDEGRVAVGEQDWFGWPRNLSLTGLVLRALDGRSDMWPGLRLYFDNLRSKITTSTAIGDVREDAYNVAFVALCGILDPDATHRAACAADVVTAISNRWALQQQAAGNWKNPTYGTCPWNGGVGTISVTHGSTTVTGSGTQWQSSQVNGNAFWVADDPTGYTGDPVSYTPTYVSATQVTLDRPYEGTTRSGVGWEFGTLVGNGTQPFMMGIVGNAMHFAYLATGDARAKQFVIDVANWIRQYGYRPATKGLYYGRYYPNCEPISEGMPNCAAESVDDSRFLSGEVLGALARGYQYSASSDLLTAGDTIFGAAFGKDGGPQSDTHYVSEIQDGGWALATKKAKDFGFFFGFGADWAWPAARLGVARPAQRRIVFVGFDLASVSQAVSVRLTLTNPDGSSTQVICSDSPCSIQSDARQGDPLLRLEYLGESGSVLASGAPIRAGV